MKKYIISFIVFIMSVSHAFASDLLTAQADSAYNKEDYATAVELYNKILSTEGKSADVYYNLGNTWYRRGKIAQSILAYERALRIEPTHSDARTNLQFVNSTLEDKPEDNNSFLTRLHNTIITSMNANAWAWVTLLSFAMICATIALYIFSPNIAVRKIGFFGAIVLILATFYFVIVTINASNRIDNHSEAIVTVPSTLLNSVPRQPRQTEKVVPLHEGTKVEIIDSVATPDDPVSPKWYNVRINGSTGAWLRATDVERI